MKKSKKIIKQLEKMQAQEYENCEAMGLWLDREKREVNSIKAILASIFAIPLIGMFIWAVTHRINDMTNSVPESKQCINL